MYLFVVSGLLAGVYPLFHGFVISHGMLNGINRASPSAGNRKESLIESVLVCAVLILLILAPSAIIGWLFGLMALVASAWSTFAAMSVTLSYPFRRM